MAKLRNTYMTKTTMQITLAFVLPAIIFGVTGCGKPAEKLYGMDDVDPAILETTLSSFAQFYQHGAFDVEAYALVGGLYGTGSSECEPLIRARLIKYIQKQIESEDPREANTLINSLDTAVVYIRGVIPPVALRGESFDIKVFPLYGTQTTSLEGGRLFATDLVQNANTNYSKTVATGVGPIFVNKVAGGGGASTGYFVLGGGKVIVDAPVSLVLNRESYFVANAIRNRVNERFGSSVAKAASPEEVQITIPVRFRKNKRKFLSMIEQLYLGTDPQLMQKRINLAVANIQSGTGGDAAELALESIGKSSVPSLLPLLQSDDLEVKFRAGRCLMNLGSSKGLDYLRKIIRDKSSDYRVAAINAIGTGAKRNEAVGNLNAVLADDDFDIKFAAYENLRRLNAFTINKKVVGGNFTVESVLSEGSEFIYVSRSGAPKIVLFGAPVNTNPDVFAKSADGDIVISAQTGKKFISLMRKHPTKPNLIGPFLSSNSVSDIVRMLGNNPIVPEDSKRRPGLGVPYSEIIMLLEKMSLAKMIDAPFVAGAMTVVKPISKPADQVPTNE
jgi:hypothetical protein